MNLILMFAAVQAANAVPGQAVVQRAVERLDMTSFPNSLRPQTRPNVRTLSQFGRQRMRWSDGKFEVVEADGSWIRMFRPLRSPRGRIRLCFTDQAQNGGTYLTVNAIELSPGRNGLYRARTITHRDCESYAR